MINYKQILTLAVFGTVNLCILGTVVCEEKDAVNGGVEIDGSKHDAESVEGSEVISTDKQPDSETNDLNEMELINYEKVEDNEKPVDDQNIGKFSEQEKGADKAIILKGEDQKVQEIENVVQNGEIIVHPFEIAENLYKLGEYKVALELYELIDKNKIGSERRIWVLYQIANCYRKQELYDDAVMVYKELQDGYEGTYWSKQAQWYIQDIEWRTKVEEEMVKVIK